MAGLPAREPRRDGEPAPRWSRRRSRAGRRGTRDGPLHAGARRRHRRLPRALRSRSADRPVRTVLRRIPAAPPRSGRATPVRSRPATGHRPRPPGGDARLRAPSRPPRRLRRRPTRARPRHRPVVDRRDLARGPRATRPRPRRRPLAREAPRSAHRAVGRGTRDRGAPRALRRVAGARRGDPPARLVAWPRPGRVRRPGAHRPTPRAPGCIESGMAVDERRIAVLGTGRIGEALISGLLSSGWRRPEDIVASSRRAERLVELAERYGIATTMDNV